MCISVFERDGEAEPLARWVELPVIATGSFLIRYVSICQLSSTYENISTTILSADISVRHIALDYNMMFLLYIKKCIHCVNEI